MSISSENRKAGPYTGNGIATSFSFSFKVFQASDLVVTRQLISSGAETTLVLNTDYTVSLNPNQDLNPGGSVVLPSALAATFNLTITSGVLNLQPTSLTNAGGFYPTVINDALDRATILVQQLRERLLRSISYPVSDPSNVATTLPAAAQRASKVLSFDANGAPEALFSGVDIQNASANAIAAAASATAASGFANAASSSASAASASASAAQTAAQSVMWNDVVYVTSNTAIDSTYRGKLVVVDASAGAVAITLPSIASLNLSTPFAVGVKKSDSSGNQVTITPNGTDTINGLSSKIIAITDAGTTLTPDVDPAPDMWNGMDFGAVAGNYVQNAFSGNGSTTAFTLTTAPGTKNNTQVYISGVYQAKSTYSVSGTTLTFTQAPPSGTNNIEVILGIPLAAGVPSDNSVSTAKLVDSSVTTVKIADSNVTTAKILDSNITLEKLAAAVVQGLNPAGTILAYGGTLINATDAPSGYLFCNGSTVSRATYAALFNALSPAQSCNTTNGSATVTVTSSSNMRVGMSIFGNGIPANAVINSITNSTTIVISSNATVTQTGISLRFGGFGTGDGSTTFDLPDLRGRFLRAVDMGTARDPDASSRSSQGTGGNTGNTVGSVQGHQYASHNHGIKFYNGGPAGNNDGVVGSGNWQITNNNTSIASGGNETRPLNAYVNYIIKT